MTREAVENKIDRKELKPLFTRRHTLLLKLGEGRLFIPVGGDSHWGPEEQAEALIATMDQQLNRRGLKGKYLLSAQGNAPELTSISQATFVKSPAEHDFRVSMTVTDNANPGNEVVIYAMRHNPKLSDDLEAHGMWGMTPPRTLPASWGLEEFYAVGNPSAKMKSEIARAFAKAHVKALQRRVQEKYIPRV